MPMQKAHRVSTPRNLHWKLGSCRSNKGVVPKAYHCIANPWNWHSDECWPAETPSSAIRAATLMPRLLKDAKKKSRLMGLSKPLASKKVDRMKKMPRRDNMAETLSAIIIALIWPGVACTAMMGDYLLDGRGWRPLRSVNSAHRVALGVTCKVLISRQYP